MKLLHFILGLLGSVLDGRHLVIKMKRFESNSSYLANLTLKVFEKSLVTKIVCCDDFNTKPLKENHCHADFGQFFIYEVSMTPRRRKTASNNTGFDQ